MGFSIKKSGYFVLKLDGDLIPEKVSAPAYGIRASKFYINVTRDNKILNSYTFIDTANIDGKSYFNGKNVHSTYLTYLDSNLKVYKNALLFTSYDNYAAINSIKYLTNGDIIIAGIYEDSISLIPGNYKNDKKVALFACLDSNLKLKWAKKPEINTGTNYMVSELLDVEVSGDYIYAGGFFRGDAIYDDFNLPKEDGIFWFFKTDNRGNILWMNKIGTSDYYQYINSISANKQKEILKALSFCQQFF